MRNILICGPGAMLAAAMVLPSLAQAADANAATTTLVNPRPAEKNQFGAPDKIYSTEEIRSARPLEWAPAPNADPRYQSGQTFREEPPPVTEPARTRRPGAPAANADREAQKAFSEQWRMLYDMDMKNRNAPAPSGGAGASGGSTGTSAGFAAAGDDLARENIDFGTADTYTAYLGNYWLNQQQAYPWKVVGKLLIDGGGYCTAQSITGAPKNIIVTAAHCVYDVGRGFKSGWTFVPAERNGAAPYGQYRWASARVLNAWISGGGRRNDVAIIRLQNNPTTGRPVSYYTGWLGWRMNFPYVRNLHSIGYASNISTLYTSMCTAESYSASCEGTDVLVKGCNMTYGSSGGAWISNYKPYQVSGYVEGVVSGPSCTGSFGNTYVAPHFSSSNLGVLCSAEGGCTTP